MDIDNLLLVSAMSLGVYQIMYEINEAYKRDDLSDIDPQYIMVGVLAGLLWSVYNYRKGSNYYSLYSMIGSLIGLYTLYRIYKEREEEKQFP
jgi:lipid-A-disaccharide synthase-like uncharacterized protein